MVNPTATRLAAPAPTRTTSLAAREASSARAARAVFTASKPAAVTHTHSTNTIAPTSDAQRAATDHDAPTATATAAATRPLPYPTITRLAARPEWSGGAVETGGSDARTAS